MLSLLRSECFQARKAFSIKITFIITIILGIFMQINTLDYYKSENMQEQLTVGGNMCSTMEDTAMCMVYACMFAGLMIGGAFENRTIQGEICSGKKRFNVFMAKMLMYMIVVGVMDLAYWFSGQGIIYCKYGMGTPRLIGHLSNPVYLAGMVAAALLAYMSMTAICGMLGFLIRRTGAIMGVCFSLIMFGGTMLIKFLPDNAVKYVKYTPLHLPQNVLKYDIVWNDILKTGLISLVWIVIILGFGIWRFHKAELK